MGAFRARLQQQLQTIVRGMVVENPPLFAIEKSAHLLRVGNDLGARSTQRDRVQKRRQDDLVSINVAEPQRFTHVRYRGRWGEARITRGFVAQRMRKKREAPPSVIGMHIKRREVTHQGGFALDESARVYRADEAAQLPAGDKHEPEVRLFIKPLVVKQRPPGDGIPCAKSTVEEYAKPLDVRRTRRPDIRRQALRARLSRHSRRALRKGSIRRGAAGPRLQRATEASQGLGDACDGWSVEQPIEGQMKAGPLADLAKKAQQRNRTAAEIEEVFVPADRRGAQ